MTDRAPVLAVTPVYGHTTMTHDLLADLGREADLVDVVVVDNRGDYEPAGTETVLRPGTNLGWAGGTNLGTTEGRRPHHRAVLWMNNDTRLSDGFVVGLLEAARRTRAGIVGPFYDCHWYHQRDTSLVPVGEYRPRPEHFSVPFIDGTAMLVTAATLDRIGLLDADTYAPLGWGAEIDYCMTARAAHRRVVVSRLAYLNHERSVTAQSLYEDGYEGYFEEAYPTAVAGLRSKWGEDWRERIGVDPTTLQTPPVRRRQRVPLADRVAAVLRK